MAAFDSTAYLNNKVAQLNKTGQGGRNDWTVADAQKAISDAGLSLQDHYQQYGKNEGVSATGSSSRPQMVNPTFDADTYLQNKTAQLNQTMQGGRSNWTVADTKKAITDAGMDLRSHYQRYGAAEGVLPYAEAQIQTRGLLAPQTNVSVNQTSQGQLHKMLASDSPLMQQAATMGNQRANARGLLNSSMASQAAQGAMISAATPFAQQDAQTYFQNSQANADRQQQEYMANLNYQNQRGLNEQQYGFQRGLNEQQYGFQRGLNEQGYGFDMGRMQQQFNNEMQRMGYAYELDQRNIPQNYAANISAQTLQNVQAIQADPNLEPAAKQAAIKNAIDMANANMSWAETFYNTPMPALRIPGAA